MTGLVKVMRTEDGEEVKMAGNALTFVLYKGYFGRDLLNDIIAFAEKNTNAATASKLCELKIQSLEDFNALNASAREELLQTMSSYSFDSEFVLNFMAALMATARYPDKWDVMDLIMEIPPYWVADRAVISELMEFLSLFISQKKSVTGETNTLGIETDFTSQLLYTCIKTGVTVSLSDMGLNVLFDLLNYSAEIDARVLEEVDGKKVQRHEPMTLAEMTKAGRMRG